MNILNLVNKISITSIPSRWTDFLQRNKNEHKTYLIELNKIKKCFSFKKKETIIHGHHAKSMSIFLVVNLFFGFKNIYTVHGSYLYLSKINKILFKFIIKNTDYIIFVNYALFDQLPDYIKNKIVDKTQVICNGVEDNYDFKRIDIVKKYNIQKDFKYIFHPARFVEEKNHLLVLEGFKLALKTNDKLRLIIAGDGKLKPQIEAKIAELKLEGEVDLIGLIDKDEVFNFYEKCDLFIMPSISEGLNVSFLEALSLNCKIVVSDIKQFSQPVELSSYSFDELNITLSDPYDIFSISNALLVSIEKDKVALKENPFSINNMIESYLKLYKELL